MSGCQQRVLRTTVSSYDQSALHLIAVLVPMFIRHLFVRKWWLTLSTNWTSMNSSQELILDVDAFSTSFASCISLNWFLGLHVNHSLNLLIYHSLFNNWFRTPLNFHSRRAQASILSHEPPVSLWNWPPLLLLSTSTNTLYWLILNI